MYVTYDGRSTGPFLVGSALLLTVTTALALAVVRFSPPDPVAAGYTPEEIHLRLTLKLIADVGLVGLPNAGKSSFLSHVSAARPKIADYPFTTLVPQLGVIAVDEERSFVAADIPGLIAGAHAGLGLGDRFLRHVERTRLLVHIVDVADGAQDAIEAYELVREELAQANLGLETKPVIVALNKIDAVIDRDRLTAIAARLDDAFLISVATGEGMKALIYAVAARVVDLEPVT